MSAVALALILLVGLSACGGGDGDDGDDVATLGGDESAAGDDSADGDGDGKPVDFEDAMLEYAECMRDNGVDMPDPQFGDGEGGVIIGGPAVGGDGPSRDEFEAAEEECRPIMEEAEQSMEPPSPEEQAAMRDHALAFAECMRSKGIDMPDPEFGDDGTVKIEISDGGGGGGDGQMAPPDEEFQAAAEECEEEIGGPPLGGERSVSEQDED